MKLFGSHPRGPIPGQVRYDVHNHLLPKVDDGVADFDEAMACIQGLIDLGYAGAVVTPHIYPEVFDNREPDLEERFVKFAADVAAVCPLFRLQLGAEYWIDDRLLRALYDTPERLLRFGPGRSWLLVELSTIAEPLCLDELFEICARRNIRPIIAHVERYAYACRKGDDRLSRWRQRGALLNVSVGSFAGQHDRRARIAAETLWRKKLVDLLGTDLHRAERLPYCRTGWETISRGPVAFNTDLHASVFPVEPPGG